MKQLFLLLTVLVFFGSVQFSCTTQKSNAPEKVGLASDTLVVAGKKMQEYINNGKLAGISTLIYKNGEIIQRENHGFADLEKQKPLADNTIYRIYSMTKPITAVALMTLFDEGKFHLDDAVAKYIPEFEGAQVYNAETKTLEP